MVRLLFLVPLLMCLGWYMFLRHYGYSLRQGLKGFIVIISFNLVIALSLSIIIWLSHR